MQGGWLRRAWGVARPHRASLVGAVAASTLGGLAASAGPLVQKVIVDDVIIDQRRSLTVWLGILLLVGLGAFLAAVLRRYLGSRFSLNVQHDLRTRVYGHMHELDARVRHGYQPGDVFSRATADVTLLNGVLGRLPALVGNIVQLVTAVVAMILLSPPLALLVAACVPAIAVTSKRMRERLFPAAWHDQQSLAAVTSIVAESATGVRVIKAFGRSQTEVARYTDASRHLYRSRLRTIRLSAFYGAMLEALPGLAQVLVVVAGGLLAINGAVTVGTFVVFASFVGQMLRPVRSLAGFLNISQQARAGAERIAAFLDTSPTVTEAHDAVDVPPVGGVVEFDRVTFGYDPRRPVLDDFSLRIEAGERVALVGVSGSGKSTFARLLVRMYDPDAGSIRLDGTDIHRFPVDSLRSHVGGVVDEPFLFSAGIADNIAFGRESATEGEIRDAAVIADIDRFVSRLPDGYGTLVGERGLTLSGGQRQRLALARAVLTDPRVLVLDDATSAVDARTEAAIHERLAQVMEGRTTLVMAHRRSTLRMVDRIVVVDRGRVVADGTHEELLESSAVFRTIWGHGATGEPVTAGNGGPHHPPAHHRRTHHPAAHLPAAHHPEVRTDRVRMAGMGRERDKRVLGAVATPALLDAVAQLPVLAGEPDHALADGRYGGRFGLRSLIGPFRAPLTMGLVLVAVSGGLGLLGPMAVRSAIDSGITDGSERMLLASGAFLLVLVVAGWIISWATAGHTSRTAERMLFVLRVRTFRHLLGLPLRFFDREMTGRIVARMTADIDSLATLFQQGLVGTAVSSVTAAGVVVVLFALNWMLALGVAVVFVPLTFLTLSFRRRSRHAHTEAREALSALYSELAEGIDGVGTTQLHVRGRAMLSRFTGKSMRFTEARLRSVRMGAAYFPAVQLLATVASAIVLGAGAFMISAGSMTTGLLLAFLLYVDQLFRPMQELSEQIDQWTAARVSLQKLDELLAEEPEPEVDGLGLAAAPSRRIQMEHVTFAYPGTTARVLHDVSLDIREGETVAVVGATGAGKSTLAKLLMAFYQPTSGRIRTDGVPLQDLDPVGYRRGVGYVQQEPVLFGVSVRDNIAYGRPGASAAEVEDVARLVGVHTAIVDLPDGYATVVGQQGRTLSTGERQLICLARALLIDPGLLILDEATANLDVTSEAWVQRAMRKVAAHRTTVVIAHRLQNVTLADRIVVLEDGRIVEDGAHEDLVAQAGTYASLWSAFADA